MDSGVTVRGFNVDSDGPVLTPTVALVADLFHAAHNTSVAFASTNKKEASSESAAPALVLVSGSAAYAPALARLAQGGQDVFVACTAKDFARLHAILPPTVRNHVLPLYMDDAFPEMLRPVEHYTSNEKAWIAAAYRLHGALASTIKASSKTEVQSSDLSGPLRTCGVLPFMTARSIGPRQLFSAFPSLFSVNRGPNGAFSVSAKSDPPSLDEALAGVPDANTDREPKHVHSITSDVPLHEHSTDAAIDDAMASVAEAATPPPTPQKGGGDSTQAVNFEEIDIELLMSSAAAKGLVENSKFNKKNLYTLLSKCGAPAKSRMTKPQLQECLAENLEMVASQLVDVSQSEDCARA